MGKRAQAFPRSPQPGYISASGLHSQHLSGGWEILRPTARGPVRRAPCSAAPTGGAGWETSHRPVQVVVAGVGVGRGGPVRGSAEKKESTPLLRELRSACPREVPNHTTSRNRTICATAPHQKH